MTYNRKHNRDDRPSNPVAVAKAKAQLDAMFGGSDDTRTVAPNSAASAFNEYVKNQMGKTPTLLPKDAEIKITGETAWVRLDKISAKPLTLILDKKDWERVFRDNRPLWLDGNTVMVRTPKRRETFDSSVSREMAEVNQSVLAIVSGRSEYWVGVCLRKMNADVLDYTASNVARIFRTEQQKADAERLAANALKELYGSTGKVGRPKKDDELTYVKVREALLSGKEYRLRPLTADGHEVLIPVNPETGREDIDFLQADQIHRMPDKRTTPAGRAPDGNGKGDFMEAIGALAYHAPRCARR
jgi:hypothetical protein